MGMFSIKEGREVRKSEHSNSSKFKYTGVRPLNKETMTRNIVTKEMMDNDPELKAMMYKMMRGE